MKERPLSPDERLELQFLVEDGREMVGDPEDLVGAVARGIDAVRQGARRGDRQRLACALGALWGDELTRLLGWEWVMLEDAGNELLSVVPADRAFALRPQLSVLRILLGSPSDNTVAALSSLLCDERRPGSYSVVG